MTVKVWEFWKSSTSETFSATLRVVRTGWSHINGNLSIENVRSACNTKWPKTNLHLEGAFGYAYFLPEDCPSEFLNKAYKIEYENGEE